MKRWLAILTLMTFGLILAETARARGFRSNYAYRYSSNKSRFGGARPATGYGSNIHRNFILKQEARRAAQGYRVRNRGNILWYR